MPLKNERAMRALILALRAIFAFGESIFYKKKAGELSVVGFG